MKNTMVTKIKSKTHLADKFACDTVCNLFYALSGKVIPKTTFDWRKVTCKNCKRTNKFRLAKLGLK